jgi:hypothetical protein
MAGAFPNACDEAPPILRRPSWQRGSNFAL